QGLRAGDGRRAAVFIEKAHPEPGGHGVVPPEPGGPGLGVRERPDVTCTWSERFVLRQCLGPPFRHSRRPSKRSAEICSDTRPTRKMTTLSRMRSTDEFVTCDCVRIVHTA